MDAPDRSALTAEVDTIASATNTVALGAALYDYERDLTWRRDADRWFHAASTIKIAVLYGVFAAVDAGRFTLDRRLHVRNRFLSIVDGSPYRVSATRDGNREVYHALGRTMRIGDLARHMIVTSSNLATNLLLDLVDPAFARDALDRAGVEGIELVRGVEDDRAFDEQVNNRVTAAGLLALLRAIHEARGISKASSDAMLDILLQQEFRSGLPAGIPTDERERTRIGNKTGEISTAAHDAGIVFVAGRQPYVLAVLTEHEPDSGKRMEPVARTSKAVYDWLVASHPPAPEQCV